MSAAAAKAVAFLGDDGPNWVPVVQGIDHDVLIVGGGQSGIAAAFALRRAGITRTCVVDAAPAGREGVWRTVARMRTLRSTKSLPGPELGIASLSFRAWFETKFGAAAFAALERCDREDWADYVDWYRRAVAVPVIGDTRVERIEPVAQGLRVHLRRGSDVSAITARKAVLATGMAGCGRPFIPPALSTPLDPSRYAHTDAPIDFAALAGKRVGVLGAASSAFDAAATALENGAASVRLFSRHDDLVRITTIKGMAYAGVLDHFHELPDADRWELMSYFTERSAGPIADTVRRATRFDTFSLHLGSDWVATRMVRGGVEVETAAGRFDLDFAIFGTGYVIDLEARPELAGLAPDIALWRDRYTPPAGSASGGLGRYPYLGEGFEFIEKRPGAAPHLADIHCFNYAASLSHGRAVGEIASLKHGLPRLAARIGRDLFLADRAHHVARLKSFTVPDLTGEEYAGAVVAPGLARGAEIGGTCHVDSAPQTGLRR